MGYFDKKQFKEGLRRTTSAPVVMEYDEMTEDPIGVSPKHTVSSDLDINEIARFVNASLIEISRLDKYEIDDIGFQLNVGGNRVTFHVKIKNTTVL